ncbi:putative lipopolysaccharide-modifying enzyme [Rhizoctonia solani]|uniref:Putative lipopolysaccharide-modifying enzyme n=1 Tax=Rhizoctonia solani TaxID=456999 RepID=A0A8H7M2J4_9AGAM|nr:putative lipopolysaccharide-modifying enzyme [Rhizoctonia solani]
MGESSLTDQPNIPFRNDDQIKAFLSHSAPTPIEHPIPKLMLAAHRKRKGVREAVRTSAPRGFDDWFNFAKENGCKIVDEYDGMVKDFEPFWQLDGAEFRRRAEQVGEVRSIDLVRIKDGKTTIVNVERGHPGNEVGARAQGFAMMIEKYQSKLPDMTLAINARSEARILVPWVHLEYPNSTNQDSSIGLTAMLGGADPDGVDKDGKLIPDWRGTGSVWDAFRKTCPPGTEARRLFHSIQGHGSRPSAFSRVQTHLQANTGDSSDTTTTNSSDKENNQDPYQGAGSDFSFVPSTQEAFDYCAHPSAHTQSGHFFSDWRTIPALYPVLSPAKAPGLAIWYTYGYDSINTVVKDVDDMEFPWDRKVEKIFGEVLLQVVGAHHRGSWRSTRGIGVFVRMSSSQSEHNRTVVYAHPSKPNEYFAHKVPHKDLNEHASMRHLPRLSDARNTPRVCRDDERDAVRGSCRAGEHWKYKYLLDLDGQSYSARFLAFWRARARVHYIPLSGGYDELYNIHAYFSQPSAKMAAIAKADEYNATATVEEPSEGDALLKKIALAGRTWKRTTGRKVDMEAYVYRLCLEYARLWADDRDGWSFKMQFVAMHQRLSGGNGTEEREKDVDSVGGEMQRRTYARSLTEVTASDSLDPSKAIPPPTPTPLVTMGDKAPRMPNGVSRAYLIAIGVLALVFLSALALSRDSIPIHLPKHALTDAHALRPHDYLNASSSDPAPFDFCPIFGPGDELAAKYGAAALAKTRLHAGTGARVQRVVHKALSGLPVTISVLGGSISACHGAGETPIASTCFATRFFNWWNSVFPHPASELTVGALRRTDSSYFAFCSAHHLPDRTDLVILDFDSSIRTIRAGPTILSSLFVRSSSDPTSPPCSFSDILRPSIRTSMGLPVSRPSITRSRSTMMFPRQHQTHPLLPLLVPPGRDQQHILHRPCAPTRRTHRPVRRLISYFQREICSGWAAARGHAFDAPRYTPDTQGKGLLGGKAAHAETTSTDVDETLNQLRVPKGRMRDRPHTLAKFREVKPFCASANDLVNPLPPSLFYGSGWDVRTDPKADAELLRHYWSSSLPTSKIRVSVKLAAGDVGVYYVREQQGAQVAEVACWVDDNVAGAVKVTNRGTGDVPLPELKMIDIAVPPGPTL